MELKVLGIRIDKLSPAEALEKITGQIKRPGKLFLVVTAYSEFFVAAAKDTTFKKILNAADLILPDGVGVLAALDYQTSRSGLQTALHVITGRVGQPVSGVWLFQELAQLAAKNGWKIFLLGGFGDTVYRLSEKLQNNYPHLRVSAAAGEQKLGADPTINNQILTTINHFKPDILFVAYGPIKQEKWLAENKAKLQVKVAMGVGGTFNELLGVEKPCPEPLHQIGLKWLWRLFWNPRRLPRIFNAVIVFPLMVFKEQLDQGNTVSKG